MDGLNQIANVQDIGTSRELVVLGDIAFPSGPVVIRSLASTADETPNVLTLSLDSGGTDVIAVIRPGDIPVILTGVAAAPYAAYNTVAGQIQVVACER
jgi:hypothetical protein